MVSCVFGAGLPHLPFLGISLLFLFLFFFLSPLFFVVPRLQYGWGLAKHIFLNKTKRFDDKLVTSIEWS